MLIFQFWKPCLKCILNKDQSNIHLPVLKRKRKLLFPLILAPGRSATEFPRKQMLPFYLTEKRKKKKKQNLSSPNKLA